MHVSSAFASRTCTRDRHALVVVSLVLDLSLTGHLLVQTKLTHEMMIPSRIDIAGEAGVLVRSLIRFDQVDDDDV